MNYRIAVCAEKKLIGKRLRMSLAANATFQLWSGFMPRRKEIKNNLSSDLISLQVYDASYDFVNFNLAAPFDKWALVEVSDFEIVPDGMETFVLPTGMYVVFDYKGAAKDAEPAFRFIFETWLPSSDFELDHRPHFEVLGANYKNNDPDSEEEIWIPIKAK